MVPLSPTGAELLFEVFSQRYERGSILVTTNLPFDEWTEVFGSERLTGALLDRLTHHVHILETNGDSYRLKRSREGRCLPTFRRASRRIGCIKTFLPAVCCPARKQGISLNNWHGHLCWPVSSDFFAGHEHTRWYSFTPPQWPNIPPLLTFRLESGERQNPSRDIVVKLSLALVAETAMISIHDVNELLLAGGFAPLRGRGESIPAN